MPLHKIICNGEINEIGNLLKSFPYHISYLSYKEDHDCGENIKIKLPNSLKTSDGTKLDRGDNVVLIVSKRKSTSLFSKRWRSLCLSMRVFAIVALDDIFNEVELQDAIDFQDIEGRVPRNSRTGRSVSRMFNLNFGREEEIVYL